MLNYWINLMKIFKLDFDDYSEDKNDENKQYDCFIE
jgi:hypothetical protein